MNSEKDYVSVLPRIIDPGMQFTKESIRNTIDTNPSPPRRGVDSNSSSFVPYKAAPNKEISEFKKKDPSETDVDNKYSFFSDYKTIIIIILIVIVIIVLSYLIYRYYNKDSKKKDKEDKEKENEDIHSATSDKDIHGATSKENTVKTYLSNYIQDDEEDDTHSVTSNDVHSVTYDDDNVKEREEMKNESKQLNYKVYGELKIPNDNINSTKVEEIVHSITNKNDTRNIYQYDNCTPVMGIGVVEMQIKSSRGGTLGNTIDIDDIINNNNLANIVMDTQSAGELTKNNAKGRVNNQIEILEDIHSVASEDNHSVASEDYTSLLDDNNENSLIEKSDIREAEQVYNHIFKNNDIIDSDNHDTTQNTTSIEKNSKAVTSKKKKEVKNNSKPQGVLPCNISSSLKVNSSDDITYFKKMTNVNN